MDQAEGSCVCGAVRWVLRPPYRFFQYCHCSRCRKRTGSAHAANIFVAAGQLDWLAGEDKVTRFDLPSAQYWSNAFCATCGSAAPWRTRNGRSFIVPAGGLDTPAAEKPSRNVHFASRASWYVPAAVLPNLDGDT
jgi:hypothetical protein